ncbi:MAG: hypothetical protein KKB20_17500, partial [Proteobacteria bacterium]|nr:hypothetical protein [Pseudomonadota bacterium]
MRVERSHITSNLVNLLEAAGRLHRLLASILQVAPCPEIVPHAFAPLSPATARLLGSTSLRKHLGGHGEESLEPSPLPIDPETIDWLCRMVDRQRARAARDLKAAGLGAAQVRGRIERIQSKLRETEIRILASRERLERLRSRCLRLKAGHISRVGNRRKGLDGLERRISVYRGHLDQVRTAGRGERIRYKSGKGQRLDPMAVTLRRAELAELRTRLEAGRAELDREQAGLEKESARLERRMAAHERLRAQSVILRRYEATALQQEALDRSVLAAGTRRCRELDQARLDLDRAQALWLELKSGIRVWSELCVRLKALGRRVPNPDRTGARDRFDRIASELGNHLQAGDDRVPGLDALRRETAELLRVRTGQESRLRVLIEQAEQDAAAVYTPSYDPQSARPMADYLEAFRTLKEE